jgi:predicted TIM-barrel fold metal-dependent hydrolase
MRVEDMVLFSIDDHVIEPPDMFQNHVPDKWADQAPRVVHEDGQEFWLFQGEKAGSMGLNAVVTWPAEEWGMDPASFAEMRPGAYDIHERIRDMNRNGIFGSMCFPTFVGFSAGHLARAADKDLSLIMLQAYNDWHIDEWAAAYPGRFIPLSILPTWDPQAMVAEIYRVKAKGCPAVTMPELPHVEGLPSYHDLDYWGPVFAALQDTGVVMCLHIGQGFAAIKQAPDAPIDNLIILATQVSTFAAQDLLWGPAFRTYPGLKVAWSEAGIGWIPFYLDRCDRHYTNQRWLSRDFGGKLPSEVFREHSLACYVTDAVALKVRHDIGMDIIAWECDYPHSDSIWPDAPEKVMSEMVGAGATDREIDQITWQNACRFFNWDPFRFEPRQQATVGALRAHAKDVDTTVRSRKEWAQLYAERHPAGV